MLRTHSGFIKLLNNYPPENVDRLTRSGQVKMHYAANSYFLHQQLQATLTYSQSALCFQRRYKNLSLFSLTSKATNVYDEQIKSFDRDALTRLQRCRSGCSYTDANFTAKLFALALFDRRSLIDSLKESIQWFWIYTRKIGLKGYPTVVLWKRFMKPLS